MRGQKTNRRKRRGQKSRLSGKKTSKKVNISREPGARVLSALNPKKPTFLYFYARATHICPCGCVCVCAHHKGFPNSSNTKKLPSRSFYDCHNPNVTHSPHVHWPGSYVHLGQPFPGSIKEKAELKETGGENGGAKSLTASTMTVAVSESNPVFWRGQPLKIWQSHKQHWAFTKGKNSPLTRLQTEAKKVYKQLAAHRQQRKKLPEAPACFQWVKNWAKLNELLLWESCMIILVYQTKKQKISDLSYRH